jgi:hypothetical protein
MTAFEVNYQVLIAIFSAATPSDYIGCLVRKPFDIEELIKHIEAELSQARFYILCMQWYFSSWQLLA